MLLALAWLVAATLPAGPPEAADTSPEGLIRVWTDREAPYRRGERVRAFFQLDRPAYVTAFHVSTDGRIRVVFPRTPWGDNHRQARRPVEIVHHASGAGWTIEDAAGIGYVFVIASPAKFDYADITRGDHWDFRLIEGGRIRGDPYVALTDLAEGLSPRGTYDYDIAPYHVGRRYDYPRFVCSECHSQPRDRDWDEYRLQCSRFRLVIHDDPIYYPYRYGDGRRVVVERPLHPGPRFVFRDGNPDTEYITRRRGQPDPVDRRRARDRSPLRPLVEQHRADERRPPKDSEPRRRRR